MDEKPQFDSSLGGTQELDSQLNLLHFAAARVKEIQAMKAALQETSSTKLAFQRLPKHMRRRVMSHNAKRLPRRLREIHLKQLQKSGLTMQLKKSTRRYRRRPSNLSSEFARRQRNINWLETHIWHAKRFHMINKWGYRLADRPCDKAFRACYRASARHCLVQDISFFSCVEISGQPELLINKLKTVCDCNAGLSFGAKAFIRGNREGEIMLFENGLGVRKAVGMVYFTWKPVELESERTLWIWIHPAYYKEALKVLIECFNLENLGNNGVYLNKVLKVSLKELKYSLNRFRLTGPLSTAVLKNTLKILPVGNISSTWLKNYLSAPKNLEMYKEQWEYWKDIQNLAASELSSHSILSLIVGDPRYNLPKTRKKAVLDKFESKDFELPENMGCGPIWDETIRKVVKEMKISNAKFAELRSELLVPGTDLGDVKDVIPVMLIQRPGDQKAHTRFGSGWDLIVPAGWANTFWMSLVMWGGRAGGLREFDNVRFESGRTSFLEPDTDAGFDEEKDIQETFENKFFRLPPNKRPNYTKFGTLDPFHLNWKRLVNEWGSLHTENLYVLRQKRMLIALQELLTTKRKETLSIDYNKNCIVPIKIKLAAKGMVKRFARMYLPEEGDLRSVCELKEPLHTDPNQAIRKKMRSTHKNLLKKLKRQRKTEKKKRKDSERKPPGNNRRL